MKTGKQFIQLLIVGLLFATASACDEANDPGSNSLISETVTDLDGNRYKTVKIGNQVWTVENLKTTRYTDGTEILNVTNHKQWECTTVGAYCNYDNLESNAATYGRLYNWHAVNSGNLAPDGWRIPTDKDWDILEEYLIANGYNYDGSKIGNKFAKSMASKTGWALSDTTGTPGTAPENNNSTGFSALPGGFFSNHEGFCQLGIGGRWWSSTMSSITNALDRYLYFDNNGLFRSGQTNECGFSVRLVKE
jgi:uncharacterized protein (TIGR02145 family)